MAHKSKLAVAVAAVVTAMAANAQQEELVLEEVLVTAQKQTQNLTKTPVAVNAISADTYNEMASFDLHDVDKLTAGVDISGDAFSIDFQVRGVGTNLDAGVPPRVTMYKDGAFVNQQRAIFLAQYDLERFELLRGPQGTLYGKASPAGQLIIHTKDPSLTKRDGYVKLSAFSRDGSNSQFGVSQPIIEDKLGIRVAGVFDKNSNGDVHNVTRDEDQISRTASGRITAKWLLTDKLDMRLSYNHTVNRSDFFTTSLAGSLDEDDRTSLDNEQGFIEIRDQHVVGEWNYAITDDLIVTNVGMYQELQTERFFDGDGTANAIQTQDVDSKIGKVLNTELRIANTANADWKWMTGIYYSTSNAATPVIATTNFQQPIGGGNSVPGSNTFSIRAENSSEDWGLFHHSGITINETDVLTIGLRYNDSRVNALSPFSSRTVIPAFSLDTTSNGQAIAPANEKREFTEWTGTIKYQRDFNEDTTGYFSWDRGWRPASATVDATGNVPNELILHDDEPSINYELGLKGKFWGGRAQYTTALFLQTYTDFQFQVDGVPVDTSGNGAAQDGTGRRQTFNAVHNADKVEIKGIEGEVTALLAPNWTAFVSTAYYDVKFDKYDDAPCNRGDSVPTNSYNTCDFSGQRASDAPNLSVVASSEYSMDLGDRGMEWYLRGLAKYESERYIRSIDSNLDKATVVDVFTGVRDNRGRWDVNLWVKNATDEAVIETVDFDATGNQLVNVNDPVTYGLTGTWRFGLED